MTKEMENLETAVREVHEDLTSFTAVNKATNSLLEKFFECAKAREIRDCKERKILIRVIIILAFIVCLLAGVKVVEIVGLIP